MKRIVVMVEPQLLQIGKTVSVNKLMTLLAGGGLRLLYAVIILIVGLWLAKKCAHTLRKILQKRHVEDTLAQFTARVSRSLIILFVVLAVLSQLGVQTASLVAVIGGMSLAIGLSLRSSLSNLASGILLVMFRPFRVGEFIQISSYSGTVKAIHLLYTELLCTDQKCMTIPNNQFMSNVVINSSTCDVRRIDFVIGISYDDDIDQAKKILQELILADSRILTAPAPLVAVKELADSAVNLLARYTVARSDYQSVLFGFTESVKKQFDHAGISMPYPQSDVHVHQGETTS